MSTCCRSCSRAGSGRALARVRGVLASVAPTVLVQLKLFFPTSFGNENLRRAVIFWHSCECRPPRMYFGARRVPPWQRPSRSPTLASRRQARVVSGGGGTPDGSVNPVTQQGGVRVEVSEPARRAHHLAARSDFKAASATYPPAVRAARHDHDAGAGGAGVGASAGAGAAGSGAVTLMLVQCTLNLFWISLIIKLIN